MEGSRLSVMGEHCRYTQVPSACWRKRRPSGWQAVSNRF